LSYGTFVERLASNVQRATKHPVLLVTYGRSGSTFTSALINHHKDVFFIFEPLVPLNLTSTNYQKQNESTAIIRAFIECDFSLELSIFLDNFQFHYLQDTSEFYDCLLSKRSGIQHVSCYIKFLKDCQSHNTILVKTIRFRVSWAETFLKENPQFKLLYLIRDPRATLFSQAQLFNEFLWPSGIINASKTYCAILDDDLKEIVRLANLYPGRVKGIRYENGATDPFTYTKDIYKFLGLGYDDQVASFIENITTASADAPDVEGAYSVIRQNSTQAMNKWRNKSDFESIRIIDSICGFMYSKLGYKFVESHSDLRSSRDLFGSPELIIFQ
ncbi:unnamed protein product, partial [Candidula unifasciata]